MLFFLLFLTILFFYKKIFMYGGIKMKKVLNLFLCFIFVISICACSSSENSINKTIETIENTKLEFRNVDDDHFTVCGKPKNNPGEYNIYLYFDGIMSKNNKEQKNTSLTVNEVYIKYRGMGNKYYNESRKDSDLIYSKDNSFENEISKLAFELFEENGFTVEDLIDYCNYVLKNDYYDFFVQDYGYR